MSESVVGVMVIFFAVLIFMFGLLMVWYQISYEILKTKIKEMYKQLKKIIKDYEDEDMDADELVVRGNKKPQSEDCGNRKNLTKLENEPPEDKN